MQVTFELPDSVLQEWVPAFAGIDVSQLAKEAFLMEACRRGVVGRFSGEKRERLPFEQLPQRLKERFEKKLQDLRLEAGDRDVDHASIVRAALEDWYVEGEGADIRHKAAVAQRISALTGRPRGEVLLALGRSQTESASGEARK